MPPVLPGQLYPSSSQHKYHTTFITHTVQIILHQVQALLNPLSISHVGRAPLLPIKGPTHPTHALSHLYTT